MSKNINPLDYKTKSILVQKKMPSHNDYWVIGLDIGYSSVKGMAPNKYFSFPSYAKKIPKDRLSLKDEQATDIKYRESASSDVWVVGSLAYDEVVAAEVMDSESELYGRMRYFSQMFLVLSRVGMAIGLMENPFGKPEDRKLVVQTGLPSKYSSDKDLLQESMAGHHSFEIKLGSDDWTKFDFTIAKEDIFVMPQPLGSLLSVSFDSDGKETPAFDVYKSSNLVIFDPGFGTMDDYTIINGNVVGKETFEDLGMREVFARTCKDIRTQFGVDLSIPELQNKLSDGFVKSMDRKAMKTTKHLFGDLLEENSRAVCMEAIERLKSVHNYFIETDYIIATGGTYDAWKDIFDQTFKDMDGLVIIPGNVNDPQIPLIFSNVRGYYCYRNHFAEYAG